MGRKFIAGFEQAAGNLELHLLQKLPVGRDATVGIDKEKHGTVN
jgi:hypothetical protein